MTVRRFYLQTFGCQMNEQDSLRMRERLLRAQFQETHDCTKADVILINTCSVRRKAEEKAYSFLGRLRNVKKRHHSPIIGVGGCVAQQEGYRLIERAPFVDVVFGPHKVGEIDRLLEQCARTGETLVEVSDTRNLESMECEGIPGEHGVKAYVTIMEGCNNFCSYCIVPFVRGRERHRPYRSIIKEIRSLTSRGVKDITLLGQNVNSYRSGDSEGIGFPALLKRLNSVEELKRVRFVTSHPKDLSDELIECFGKVPSLCEHIHLPLQAGSDAILRAMNRGYTVAEYIDKVSRLRKCVPGISITSDIIVGFPGETENDFLATLDAAKEIRFDSAFSFKYSPRPGTRASRLPDGLSEEEKDRRLSEFQKMQRTVTCELNNKMVGSDVEVLVEGTGKNRHQLKGRTRTNKIVNFEGEDACIGQLCDVKIIKGCRNSLIGVVE